MVKTRTFLIRGMHCTGCSKILAKQLGKVNGIIKAEVTYTTEKAILTFDEEMIDWDSVKQAVASVGGYEIILDQGEDERSGHHDHAKMLKEEELRDLKKRLVVAGVLTVPLLVSMIVPIPLEVAFVLASVVLFYAGKEFFVNAWMGLRNFSANMDTLVALGTGAAYFYSTVVTFWPGLLMEGHVYFEVASVIVTLILLGRFLEMRAKGKAGEAIRSLMELQAKKARVLRNGEEVEVDLNEVRVHDRLIIKPGEKVPVDGRVLEGESYLDESLVTGESRPVKKQIGDFVIGGTINSRGRLVIEATQVGEGTMLAKIIKLVEEAQGSQAPIQKLADRVSGIFVPVVILIAILAFFVWYAVLGAGFTSAMVIAITVLIISCPCALGLATPISIMVGTGRGANLGILIKNAEKLQIAGKISAVVFDKTGTLTEGIFSVTDVMVSSSKWTKSEIIRLAAALEQGSEHPIAGAILAYAKKLKIKLPEVKGFRAIEGKGVRGEVEGKMVRVGIEAFAGDLKRTKVKDLKKLGRTLAYVSLEGVIIGVVALADRPKTQAKKLILDLKKLKIDTWMITGDNRETAEVVAREVGVENVMAEVLPSQKVMKVIELQKKYKVVAMVGDGVNDAPALAQAEVGIAMATGTDVAMETADITLLRGDVELVFQAIDLSKKTMANIKQNLFWAFGYNVVLIPVAAGVLIPWGVQINPILASGAMAFSSVSVVLNALRLRKG